MGLFSKKAKMKKKAESNPAWYNKHHLRVKVVNLYRSGREIRRN